MPHKRFSVPMWQRYNSNLCTHACKPIHLWATHTLVNLRQTVHSILVITSVNHFGQGVLEICALWVPSKWNKFIQYGLQIWPKAAVIMSYTMKYQYVFKCNSTYLVYSGIWKQASPEYRHLKQTALITQALGSEGHSSDHGHIRLLYVCSCGVFGIPLTCGVWFWVVSSGNVVPTVTSWCYSVMMSSCADIHFCVFSVCVMRTAHAQKLKYYKITAHAHGEEDFRLCNFIVFRFPHIRSTHHTYREDAEVESQL